MICKIIHPNRISIVLFFGIKSCKTMTTITNLRYYRTFINICITIDLVPFEWVYLRQCEVVYEMRVVIKFLATRPSPDLARCNI